MIEIQHVYLQYHKQEILHDITFIANKGDITESRTEEMKLRKQSDRFERAMNITTSWKDQKAHIWKER